MPSRFARGRALVLATLLIALPSQSSAQFYGPMRYGPGWRVGYPGVRYGYPGYAYRPYYGYAPYQPYYGGYYGYYGWGYLGAMLGAIFAPPPPVYVYPVAVPVSVAPPPIQHCPDGSTIPMGSQCAIAAPAPAPTPAPMPAPQPAPERG